MNYCYDCRATFELEANEERCAGCYSVNHNPVEVVRKEYSEALTIAATSIIALTSAINAIEKQKAAHTNEQLEYRQVLKRLKK